LKSYKSAYNFAFFTPCAVKSDSSAISVIFRWFFCSRAGFSKMIPLALPPHLCAQGRRENGSAFVYAT
jgi:hypothetical protein